MFLPTTAAAELASAYLANRGSATPRCTRENPKATTRQTSSAHPWSTLPLPRNSSRRRGLGHDRTSCTFEVGVPPTPLVAGVGEVIPHVSLVVQAGTPDNREQFVHRSGRTGRAGTAGEAVLLVEDWEFALAAIHAVGRENAGRGRRAPA